jgi:uncharacterized protein YbjQ (UPF0145 family)
VGEVLGAIVEHIGWSGWGGCGWYAGFGGGFQMAAGPTGVVTSGRRTGYAGYRPYVDALYRGWDTALRRMLLEAQALGADGVVDVRWGSEHLDESGNREFTALGTAVRSASAVRPAHLFATELTAADVGKLFAAGHAPCGMAVGISVSVRHDDYVTQRQASSWTRANTEISGYTELVTHARSDARRQFERRMARTGGQWAIVSGMGLRIWEIEPGENHRDHVAEATVAGTAVVSSPRARLPDRPAGLTVIPLQ